MKRLYGALVLACLVAAAPLAAAPLPYVPPALEPWRNWVLEAHPEQACPPDFSRADARQCVWVRRLDLAVSGNGGSFTLDAELFARGDVVLPGDAERWPAAVTVEGRPAVVTAREQRPRLRLEPGRYRVTGSFAWGKLPDSIRVPRQLGLLRLAVDGEERLAPLLEGDVLWLGRSAAAVPSGTADSLEARVFRRIEDGVPIVLETTIDLAVAGGNRTVTVGRALPEGFTVTSLESALPARLESDGVLRVQVEPGDWRVVVRARATEAVASFRAGAAGDVWPAQEIWGFAADRALRVVTLEGARSIDLSQTTAPFRNIPGYLLNQGDELRIVEQFRGDPNPSPNEFHVGRNAWLAFAGDRFVVSDEIRALVARPTRLVADFVPGRVTVDGVPQLVTALAGSEPGVELGQGTHRVEAVSEIEGALSTALGWRFDATSLQATLHLPPGWRLIATRGVDRAPAAWIAQWNVWNLFLVLVTVAVAARLLGVPGAVLAAATLVLVYHEPGSPTGGWLLMLVLLAGIRVSRAGTFRRLLDVVYFFVFALTLLAGIAFAVDSFRKAIYPQLERPWNAVSEVPAAPPMPAAMTQESRIEEAVVSASRARDLAVKRAEPEAPREVYPEGLEVQTGPAVPRWRWTAIDLGWDGPVTAAQPIGLTLSPPWLTRLLYVVGPVLLLALLALFGAANLPGTVRLPGWAGRLLRRDVGATAALLLLAVGVGTVPARVDAAELPGQDLLEELERRLTAPPACLPGCVAFERVEVRLDERSLVLVLVVHADVDSAAPLPARDRQWWPEEARLDDRPATVSRSDDGNLRVAVPAGRHRVELKGAVHDLDRFELPFLLPPGVLVLDVAGWQVFGAEDGRLRGRALQFAREAQRTRVGEETSLRPEPVAPYYIVERELRFGLEWRVMTMVRRVAPSRGVVPFAVALLAGESVLTAQIATDGGEARGVLAPEQGELRFESTLAPADDVVLTAPPLARASERWTIVPSNLWHLDWSGPPPSKLDLGVSPGPRFHPLPGETLTLRLTRPEAVAGDSVTVESVRLEEHPGRRSRRVTLTLEVLSSQGGDFPVTLPVDAVISTIEVDGRPEPLPQVAGPLPLPIVPGRQTFRVTWDAADPVVTLTTTSAVTLPTIARNVDLSLGLSEDRWPLAVGGPSVGPAVMYWGVLVLVVLIAVALARVPGLPLTARDAVLVGLGMSLCNLPGTVIVAAWLLLLLARRRAAERLHAGAVGTFQVVQVLLAIASVVAVVSLAATVPFGLLGAPDMHVAGNGSSAAELRWFQDQSSAALPGAWVISLPLWVYRVAMLAWSLWLAFTVVRWARWAWESYAAGGAWRKVERRKVVAEGSP
jgi:hypothetical protein